MVVTGAPAGENGVGVGVALAQLARCLVPPSLHADVVPWCTEPSVLSPRVRHEGDGARDDGDERPPRSPHIGSVACLVLLCVGLLQQSSAL